MSHLYDHLAPGLLPLPLIGLLLPHLQHLVPRGLVLERELGEHFAEDVHFGVFGHVNGVAQEEQELVESVWLNELDKGKV